MGISNKKTTVKENSTKTENLSTTRTNPAWAEDALKGFTGQVTGLMGRDPLDFVADANPLQTQAGQAAAGLGGWRSGVDEAMGLARGAGAGRVDPGLVTSSNVSAGTTGRVGASSLLEGLNDYMSPYREQVVDTAMTDFDVDAGRTRAAQAASGARNSAFGGSRFGVREAQTEGELSRARATTDAKLRNDMFETGAGLSNLDAGRRQDAAFANQRAEADDLSRRLSGDISNADRRVSVDTGNAERSAQAQTGDLNRQLDAGGLMGQIADAAGAASRGDVATQLDAGGTLRDIETERRQAPLGLMGAVGDLLGQGQYELFNGTNVNGTTNINGVTKTTEDPGLMAKIGQAVQAAAAAAQLAAMSDVRLKTEVEEHGFDDRGRRWVSWRYLWEPEGSARHFGVMAQEVQETDPEAVFVGPFGFLAVDYSKLEGATWLHS